MSSIKNQRALVLAEAVVSSYINELATPARKRPSRPRPRREPRDRFVRSAAVRMVPQPAT